MKTYFKTVNIHLTNIYNKRNNIKKTFKKFKCVHRSKNIYNTFKK